MEEEKKMYQLLTVSRSVGLNFIIPDKYAYENIESAFADIAKRRAVFEARGEELNYMGRVSGLGDISKIYKQHDMENDTNDIYIYELDVKDKPYQEELIDKL